MTQIFEVPSEYTTVMEKSDNTEAIQDLHDIQSETDEKLKSCGACVLNLHSDIEELNYAIQQLQERKTKQEAKAQSLKDYMIKLMSTTERTKVETPLYSINLNIGKSKSVVVDPEKISKKFITVKTTEAVDKKAIGALLRKGTPVTGAHLEIKNTITIKT